MVDEFGKLYTALIKRGYTEDEIGDENTFRGAMADKANRKELYDWVSERGDFGIGDYDVYEQRLSRVKPANIDKSQYTFTADELGIEEEQPEERQSSMGMFQMGMAPITMGQAKEITKSNLADKEDEEHTTGVLGGMKQGTDALYQSNKYFAGEVANAYGGGSKDAELALERLESGRVQEDEGTPWWKRLARGVVESQPVVGGIAKVVNNVADLADVDVLPEINQEKRADKIARQALEDAGGDEEKAKKILSEKAATESWGDVAKKEAADAMSKHKPIKGAGAWIGNLIPQMVGTGASIAIGAINPIAGAIAGAANMGVLTGSTMGSSMQQAREEGASDEQVWAAGLVDGVIEMATEQIPFSRYTGRIFGAAKKKISKEMMEAVAKNPKARKELEKLVKAANEELGGRLFTKANVKDYLGDILAEGGSELVAGALQTMTPMLYQNPEDYPTLTEIAYNGLEGAAAGMFMGAVLGGTSKGIEYKQNRNRRKAQGEVYVAEVQEPDAEKPSYVEIVGVDKNKNTYDILTEGKIKTIPQSDVKRSVAIPFQEFDNAAIEFQQSQAEDEGYNTTEPQAMNDAKLALDAARQRLPKSLNEEAIARLEENPIATIELLRGDGASNEEIQSVLDFNNAKAKYDGMTQRVSDDIDSKIAESDAIIDSQTRADGNILTGTIKGDGRQVFIISGNVEMVNDKVESPEGHLIVLDNGEQKMIAPDQLQEVASPINAATEKARLAEEIRTAYNAEAENKINGVLAFKPGDVYEVVDNQGKKHTISVLNDLGETIEADVDGKSTELSKATVQAMVNDANKARVADPYALNKEVAVNIEGGVVNGVVIEAENEDGMITVQFAAPSGEKVVQFTREELNGMQPKLSNAQQPASATSTQTIKIPMEGKGKNARQAYHLVPIERTMEELHNNDLTPEEISAFIDNNISEVQKELQKVEAIAPKMGTDIAAYKQAKTEWQKQKDAIQAKLDYYNELKNREAEAERSELKEIAEAPVDVIGDNISTPDELVSTYLGGIKITPESFKRETGLGNTDQQKLVGYIAGKDKGGVSVERAAEIIYENYGHELAAAGFAGDVQEIRDMIISVLVDGSPKTYAKRGAEMRAKAEVDARREEIESFVKREFDMELDDYIAYEESVVPRIIQDYTGFDEQEYYSILANEYNNEVNYDTERESESTGRGGNVLQAEQSVDARGVESVGAGNQRGAVPSDVQGGSQDAVAQGEEVTDKTDVSGDKVSPVEPVGISEQFALQNGNNELTLQQENEQNNVDETNISRGGQVSQSVPQGEHGEKTPLFGGAQETAARLRERIESAQGDSKSGLREIENRVTRQFAQENGLWIEDEGKLGVPFPSGDEHNNYIDAENQVVYKVNNRMHTPSILELLDRIELHNKYFPDTQYRLVGFTAISDNSDVWPVFAQEFVSEVRMATNEEIDGYMSSLGFTPMGNGRYTNGEIVAKDLHPRNALVNPNGDVYVVDAEFEPAKQEGGEKTSSNAGNSTETTPEWLNKVPDDGRNFYVYVKFDGESKYQAINLTNGTTVERLVYASMVEKGKLQSLVKKLPSVLLENAEFQIRDAKGNVYYSSGVINAKNKDTNIGYNYELEQQTYERITSAFRTELNKGGLPNLKTLEKYIKETKKSIKVVENGLALAGEDTVEKGFETLAILKGRLRAYTDFRNEVKTRLKEAENSDSSEIPNNSTVSQESEQVSDQDNAPYTIAPAQYTTKKGKVLDMHLVKFAGTLTKEQQRAAKELAKADKGWYDREQGGFMMRSEESAKQLADTILNNDDAVSDAQPVSMIDIQALNNGDVAFTEPKQTDDGPVWQYSIHVDADGYTTISRDDVRSGYPIGDARFRYSTDSPEEMLDILRNPLNGMQEALEAVGVTLENKIKTRNIEREAKEIRRREYEALRENGVNGYEIGEKVIYTPASGTREPIEATIHDFEEFGAHNPVLDVGMAPVMYEVAEWGDITKVESSKTALLDDEGAVDDKTLALSAIGKTFTRMGETEEGKPYEETMLFAGIENGKVRGEINSVGYGGALNLSIPEAAEALRRGRWQEQMKPKNEGLVGLVSDERMAELKERLRKKLGGQMNIGIDPEILAIGLEIAVGHIDRGVKSFADFARVMIAELGDAIRPYLKAFYNGARELPEITENGFAEEMTPYNEVQAFDVANFDKQVTNAIAAAETIAREQEVNEEVEIAQERIKKIAKSEKKSVTSQPNQLNLFEDGREEDTRADNSRAQLEPEKLSDIEQVGARASIQHPAKNSESKRGNNRAGRNKLGDRPGYDVNKNYTNEEIGEIVSSVTDIVDGKVVITGEVTDDIKAIIRGYKSGGVAKQGRGILDEYYTDGKIVDAVNMLIAPYYEGTKGNRVLEPSVGVGNFIEAVDNIPTSEVVAFEINDTTARIAKILYPEVDVNLRSFETEFIDESGNKKPLPKKYNLIIGNPPYGSHRGLYKGLGEESKIARYEDYFVKRSLDVLEEGGVLAMVLPSSWIDRHTKFGGYTIEVAYRLPSGAFEATQVGTDIVVLKKDSSVPVVERIPYFKQHPERVLGDVKERTGRYGRTEQYVEGNIDAALEAIKREHAERLAEQLNIEKSNDNLNDIETAIEETGGVEKAKPVVENAKVESAQDAKPVKSTKSGKYKVELNRGAETVPTSSQFTHEFSEGEVEAFADTEYDGTLNNPTRHKKYANYIGGRVVHDFYYTEGDVYDKLAQLEQDKSIIIDTYGEEQYNKQKGLLENVLPKRKGLGEITISPNTTFVKNLYIETAEGSSSLKDAFIAFCRKLPHQAFGDSSSWEVVGYVNNEQVHGTDKYRNQRVRERRKRVANDLFIKFLNEELSDKAKNQVVAAFNREYNSVYRPDYSRVPMFSTINRIFKDKPLKLTDVQLAGIGRMTVKGVGVLAHEVGFGKTLSGILAMHEAMTRGFAKKPLIVVPNDNILKQWVETIKEVLPKATVNTLGNLGASYDLTDFKVNDGEFTIVTYEGLKAMSFSDDTYNRLADRFSYITEDLKKHQSERDIQKEIEKHNELKGKMKRGAKAAYGFEDFGFDWLTVDEVHNANHIVSKVRLDKSVSSDFRSQNQRTSDLGLKTWLAAQYIQEENNGRNVLLLSATPFTNKPLEYYSILSLVANKMLERKGFFNVDQFFATFMEADNEMEMGANNRPVQKTNVRRFRNNGLFQQLLSEFIDIKGEEDNPELIRPTRLNKEYKFAQNELTTEAIDAAQELLNDNDTVLQGISHARAAAFSPYATSLLGVLPKDHKEFVKNSPKIDATIKMIEQNRKDRPDAGQIIYSEVGVEFFPMMRDYLVKESGFKPNEVRIITGATSNSERVNIQTAFNNGEVKVVIGSPAIKEGLNLQGNTTDMYILSLPWNFTQLRQIEGRGWRQGNKWENIRINYMLTNDSVDVFMLQRLQLKQGLYNEAMKSGAESLDVSDIDTAELKTALITDPAVRAEIVIQQEREKLLMEKTQIEADLSFVMRKYEAYNKLISRLESQKGTVKQYKKWAEDGQADGYWSGRLAREEEFLQTIENEIEQEKENLAKKGVNVDDIVHQTEQAQSAIAAIQEKIDNLKEYQQELTEKYRKENEEKAKREGDLLATYLKERKAENNSGFYKIRPKEGDKLYRTSEEIEYKRGLAKQQRAKAEEVAKKLNVEVEIQDSVDGITGRQRTKKGWFDPRTGKITIVIPNHSSTFDVEQTLLHEAVAHYGLRALFGKDFDTFLDNVYNNVTGEIKAEIDALAEEKYNGDKRVATEEYLASLAERTNFENAERSSWWQQVKDFFMDMLAKAGVKLDAPLSDNELRYMLWKSYKNLAEGGTRNLIDEAIDIAKQYELGVGNFAKMNDGKENSVYLQSNLKITENDNTERRVSHTAGRAGEIISRVRRAYDRAGRASNEANSRVAESIKKANAEGTIIAYNPLLRETLNLLRRLTNNEIYNEFLPLIEVLRDNAKSEQERDEAKSIIELIRRFRSRNERGTIIRDLLNADLGDEIPISKIDELFEMYNSDASVAELYKRVRGFAEELGISFTFKDLDNDKLGGVYHHQGNSITFNAHILYAPYASQQKKASTIVHEIIHAVTVYAMAAKKNNAKLSPKLEKAVKIINDIYENVVKGNPVLMHEEYNAKTDKMELEEDYGTTSAYEMVAELSNLEFADKLKQLEYDGRSVWQKIWDTIKSIFVDSQKETKSVYEQLSKAFDTLIENFDKDAFERSMVDYEFYNIIKDGKEQKPRGGNGYNTRRTVGENTQASNGENEIGQNVAVRNSLSASRGAREKRAGGERRDNTRRDNGENGEDTQTNRREHTVGRGTTLFNALPTSREKRAGGEQRGVSSPGTARELYDKATRVFTHDNNVKWNENLPYRLLESYQDSMLALKKFQEAVTAETGNEIRSFENAYIAENQMSSKNKAEQEMYERDFYNPLLAEINSLIKGGASYDDIRTYLFAKHGLERNVYMRAAAAKDKALEEMGKKPAVPKETDADYEAKVAEYAVKYRNRDFSGLTELTKEKNYTAAAQKIVEEFEGEYNTKSLWEAINKATKETLRKSYESGLMSKDVYDKVNSMYKYYIPLRGWNVETAEDVYEYMTSNTLMLSPALKKAKGRRSLADDPIATIGHMAISSIVQGNRNLMKQRFLNFVLNNPTSLATVSNQWYVKNNESGDWEPSLPQIPEDATADEVNEIVKKHSERMELLQSFNLATQERGGLEITKPIKLEQVPEHIVRVKRAGKEYCIYINGSPRAAQAVNGLTNPDSSNNALYKGAQVVKNWMARMFTSQNPAFIVTNLSRDILWAGTAVAIKEDVDYVGRYTANIAAILAKAQLPRLVYKWKNGTLDMNVPEERYFAEFIKNGGETGFTQINTVEDFKRNIERSIKDVNRGALHPKKAARSVLDGIEFLNRSAEDTTRFAVYMTSRQMGRDVQQSVNDAKEITVNFNKKGSGGLLAKELNFLYIFFNASIQSTANFGKLLKHHPKKTMAAVSAFAMSGFLLPMLNVALQSMFGDDDEYWDLPEWVRRNNIVIYCGVGYAIIPLPHELRPFYGMGELAFSVLMGKEEPAEAIMKAGAGFLNLLPLDFTGNGGNLAVNLTPTIGQPFAQLFANTDYFGIPIYKKHDFNENDPEWKKAYKGTATWLVDGTKWLNEVTGGDNVKSGVIDFNPAQIEHLFESYLGGVGKTINRTAKTISMLWDEDLREWRNVPIVSSFYQQGGERTKNRQINARYYDLMEEYEETERLLRGYKKEARINPIEYAEKLKELLESPLYKRYVKMKGYKKAVEKYNKYIKDNEKVISDDKREDLETKILDFKTGMFEELEKLEDN